MSFISLSAMRRTIATKSRSPRPSQSLRARRPSLRRCALERNYLTHLSSLRALEMPSEEYYSPIAHSGASPLSPHMSGTSPKRPSLKRNTSPAPLPPTSEWTLSSALPSLRRNASPTPALPCKSASPSLPVSSKRPVLKRSTPTMSVSSAYGDRLLSLPLLAPPPPCHTAALSVIHNRQLSTPRLHGLFPAARSITRLGCVNPQRRDA
ncbi:hypothetical protein C8R44DRAFT_992129 [Mycena epipterygia]|nr:hypothetical protein C8R44DRAFT_992129 [Mycena epipterygia]